MTFDVSGYLLVPDDDLPMVLELMPTHIALSRAEPGCLKFDLWQDPQNPNHICLSESFQDRAAFDTHAARGKASEWGQKTSHMTRHFTFSA